MVAFERALDELRAESVAVIALSTDDAEHAEHTATSQSLSFPIGFGAPLIETARTLGAYYEQRRQILHATGFVVRPDRTIAVACYSSGPIGRLVPDDVLGFVRFWSSRA